MLNKRKEKFRASLLAQAVEVCKSTKVLRLSARRHAICISVSESYLEVLCAMNGTLCAKKRPKSKEKNGRLTLDNILRVTLGEDAQMMRSDPWRGGDRDK